MKYLTHTITIVSAFQPKASIQYDVTKLSLVQVLLSSINCLLVNILDLNGTRNGYCLCTTT